MKIDLANPAWRQTLPPARSVATDAPVAACAFSRDGTTVAFALGDGACASCPPTSRHAAPDAAAPLHKGAVLSLVGDPAGDGFVSGGDDGRLLRIGRRRHGDRARQPEGQVDRASRRPRATGAVAASAGKTRVRRRQTARSASSARIRARWPTSTSARTAAASPARTTAASPCGASARIVLPPRRFAWRGSHVALRWSTDGKFIATGTQENDIHVWRMAQATDMRMQGYPAKVKSLSWTADARFLYTSSQPVFTAWPFAGKGPEGKPPLQFGDEGAGLMTVVAAHPTAEFVAGGYDSGELQLGDIKTKRSVVLKMADGSAITCLAWSPDGFKLAVGNERGDLLVIDLRR